MKARFIYEAIKHLKPRSEEEISMIKRNEIRKKLSDYLDEDTKNSIIDLSIALEKAKIKSYIYVGENNKDYEFRITDFEYRDPNLGYYEENEAYRSYLVTYITEETLKTYSPYLTRNNVNKPCFAIFKQGNILLHTTNWHEIYQHIIEIKNEFLDERISELKNAIQKIQNNKIKT